MIIDLLSVLASIAAVVVAGIALRVAVKSNAVSKEAVALTRAAQHHAQRPVFEITAEQPQNGVCYVTVRMVDGPPEILVDAEYTASVYLPDGHGGLLSAQRLNSLGSFACGLVKNDAFALKVDDVPFATDTISITVTLCCKDEAEGRQWPPHIEVVEWPH